MSSPFNSVEGFLASDAVTKLVAALTPSNPATAAVTSSIAMAPPSEIPSGSSPRSCAAAPAASSAIRVLPTPGGPTSVMMRSPSAKSRATMAGSLPNTPQPHAPSTSVS